MLPTTGMTKRSPKSHVEEPVGSLQPPSTRLTLLGVPPVLSAPPVGEGGYRGRRQPDRVYDTQVLETALGASPAKQVLGDLESGCRLRGCEHWLVVVFRRGHDRSVADHRLTKILVLA